MPIAVLCFLALHIGHDPVRVTRGADWAKIRTTHRLQRNRRLDILRLDRVAAGTAVVRNAALPVSTST